MERKELGKSFRGKRYAIDAERLLSDTDVYYLSYIGKISTEVIKSQLKDNKLTYMVFKALEDNGFNIRDYWVIDSEINTVKVDENLLYTSLESVAKYKKLAYKLDGFMAVRQFKPLKSYLEFCDSINVSYLTYCDDEDYLLYLDELEKKQFRGKEEKPKAYIKAQMKPEQKDKCGECKLMQILQNSITWHEKDYGDDLKGIITTFASLNNGCTNSANMSSVKMFWKKYRTYLREDFQMAWLVNWIERHFNVSISKPSYANGLLSPQLWMLMDEKFIR